MVELTYTPTSRAGQTEEEPVKLSEEGLWGRETKNVRRLEKQAFSAVSLFRGFREVKDDNDKKKLLALARYK